jgi:Flp pilus assembly secretin CpaC
MWPRLIGAALFFGFLLIGNTLNAQEVSAQPMAESIELPLSVPVNKALVLRLPRPAKRMFVTQPLIAESVVLAPDLIIINGKSIGTTSLVVWFDEPAQKSR